MSGSEMRVGRLRPISRFRARPGYGQSKRPGRETGPCVPSWRLSLRRLVDHLLAFRLGSAARALGERRLDLLDGLGLGDALHRRDLARQAVERRFVELALGVRLLGLALRAVEVAYHLGDGDDVARVDLGLVFLRAA